MADDGPESLWYYVPSKAAAGLFLALFLLTGAFHTYQNIHYKSWRVTGLYPWGATLFIGGFIARIVGTYHLTDLGIYIASSVLLLLAPPVFEGANYFILGRLLYYVPYHSPIHPGRVVTTFLGLDLVIGVLTGNGASYASNSSLSDDKINMGKSLLKAALLMQIFCMVLYIAIAARYQFNCTRAGVINDKLKSVLLTLYISCSVISCRTIYRTYEYWSFSNIQTKGANAFSPNQFSPVLKHEWFFYVFECTLMFFVSVLMNVRHPLKYLPKNNKIYLATDGVTEIEGPGYGDKRPFLLTLFDPFDIIGLVTRKDKQNRFWETHEDVPQQPHKAHQPKQTA